MHARKLGVILVAGSLVAAAAPALAVDEIPEKRMDSRGGVLYPHTGDGREIFQTPPNARTLFPPGTLIGVLPGDCVSASKGAISYFRCDYDFALEEMALPDGRTVYQVIETP